MMHWPQIILSSIFVLTFALHCEKAGEPRGSYTPIGYLIGAAIELTILYYGGFFAVWGWAP